MHALSLLALLLPLVAADTGYAKCDCQTASGSGQTLTYNHDLSRWLCYHVYTNTALWSESEGRCIATQQPIPGDDWQTNCILIGVRQGYFAFDNKGNPITNVPAMKVETAVGNCD
ncbi:uncharacterized protein CPUR_03096 [Claviceps purpurea 20.1]|uniref:Uncharacterized protein n=1 Tax=Claviceps purpurea (strain 20.1) TaxID=1111077 RepID=M1W8P8_CLAP2|nr:hypothetical protein E4U50_002787 [Claviceps purpurea]CCE29403.1 uncharacterized protein CPUR_03096 [Claviceps purpurea 20.1]